MRRVLAGLVLLLLACGTGASDAPTVRRALVSATPGLTLQKGEALTPKFSILSDTVLGVVNGTVVARGCGQSRLFMRWWKGATAVVAETTVVNVACAASPPPPPTTTMGVELPRLTLDVDTPTPSGGRIVRVPGGTDLQAVLNAAQPGDQLVLQAGATWVGNFVLPAKATDNDHWITLTTDGQLPPAKTRVGPTATLPRLVSATVEPTLRTAWGAAYYAVRGVEVTTTKDGTYSILTLGGGWPDTQTQANLAHHLVLDRVYVHGARTIGVQRCVALNAAWVVVRESYLDECAIKGFDSQAIGGWNGPGPFTIVNNRLRGAGENVMFGGSDAQSEDLQPQNLTFQYNYVDKDTTWKGVRTVKNLFELKAMDHALVEGNVFENNWVDAQNGMGVVLKVSNQDGGAPWTKTQHITYRYNILRNSPGGYSFAGAPEAYIHPVTTPANHFLVEHNLALKIQGRMVTAEQLDGLTFRHNAGLSSTWMWLFANNTMQGLVVTGNIGNAHQEYGATVASADGHEAGPIALDYHAPGWVVTGNCFLGEKPSTPAKYQIPNNVLLFTLAAELDSLLTPSATSPCVGMGPDIVTLRQKTAIALSGVRP